MHGAPITVGRAGLPTTPRTKQNPRAHSTPRSPPFRLRSEEGSRNLGGGAGGGGGGGGRATGGGGIGPWRLRVSYPYSLTWSARADHHSSTDLEQQTQPIRNRPAPKFVVGVGVGGGSRWNIEVGYRVAFAPPLRLLDFPFASLCV